MQFLKPLFALLVFIVLSTQLHAQVPSYVPVNGLVGWWSFNGNANDESGNGNHGVVSGATLSSDRNNVPNQSYAFNGISDHIYTAATGLTDMRRTTVSAWIKYIGDAGGLPYDTYFQFGDRFSQNDQQHSLAYAYNYTGKNFELYQTCKGSPSPGSNINNSWHHVVVVQDSHITKVYVDASLIDSVDHGNEVCYLGTNTIWIGASPSDYQYVTGNIDDIGFWERALTTSEIIAIYTASPTGLIEPKDQTTAAFPNPVTDELTIYVDSHTGNVPVQLFDALGRVVYTGKIKGSSSISMRSLPAGTYYLQVFNASRTVHKITKI